MKKLILSGLLIMCAVLCSCDSELFTDIPEIERPDTTTTEQTTETPAVKTSFGLPFSDTVLNPVTSKDSINADFYPLLYDSLFKADREFMPQPSLCESYTFADGVMVITLKKVEFSDGSLLRAEDVVYSLLLAKNTATSPYAKRLVKIRSAAADAAGTVTVVCDRPCGALPALLDFPVIKKDTGTDKDAVGTGRFVFVRDADGICYLKQNAKNKQAKPLYSRIELIKAPDRDSVLFSYDSGDIDLVNADTTAANSVIFTGASDMLRYDTNEFHFIGINTRHGALSLPAARVALASLFDRAELCSKELNGGVSPSAGFFPVGATQFADSAAPQAEETEKYDVNAAFSGVTLVFAINRDNIVKTAAAKTFAASLTSAGVACEVKEYAWDDYIKVLKNGDFDFYYGEIKLTPDFNLSPVVASGSSLNYGKYSDETANAMLNDFLALDFSSCAAQASALDRYLQSHMPVIPLGYQSNLMCVRSGMLSNITPTARDLFDNIDAWRREK